MEEGFFSRNHCNGAAGKLYKPYSNHQAADALLQYIDDDPASYPNLFDNAKSRVTEDDKARLIAELKILGEGTEAESVVDTEEVIRYFAAHSFLVNANSYTGSRIHNYYLYEENGKLRMIPWDYSEACFEPASDRSAAESAAASVNYPIDTPVTGPGVSARPMLAWILEDEERTERYHEAYRELMDSVYDSGWLQEEIDRIDGMISSYVESDPTAFCTYEEYRKAVETLKEFFRLRCQSVAGQLDGTIPSTREGQARDKNALVDASSIDADYLFRPLDDSGGDDEDRGAASGTGETGMTAEETERALVRFGACLIVLAAGLVFAMRKRICR